MKPLRLLLILMIGLLGGLHQAVAQVSFAPATNYPVGTQPECVIATDIYGDGKVDLIAANFVGNTDTSTLTVLTNNGSGVFGSNATLTVGANPVSIVAADFNCDGKVDLVSANLSGTLTVLTNAGNRIFGSNATYTVDGSLQSVAAADINGDGKIDLICVDHADSKLIVLTNNGGGIFGSNGTYSVGSTPDSVVAADINGEGKLDLISASINSHSLTVLTNNGSCFFVVAFTLPDVGNPQCVVAADVNADGKPDLISVSSGNTLSVLINTSTFPPPTSTPTLNINPSGKSMLVSWPSASAGWSLQQNPDLTTANWSPGGYSGYAIADDGTNKSLMVTPPTGNLFFRLVHP